MPDPVKKLIEEGDQLTQKENYREALARYQTAFNLASPQQKPSLLLAIGICYAYLFQQEDAEQSCQKFEATTPLRSAQDQEQLDICKRQIAAIRSKLRGDKARDARDFPTARAEYQAAYLFSPSPDFLRSIAECFKEEQAWSGMLEQCGRYESTLQNPNEDEAQYIKDCRAIGKYELAKEQCYDQIRNQIHDAALQNCRSVYADKHDLGVLLRVGFAHARLKQYREAQPACERYANDAPRNSRSDEDKALLADCQSLVREGLAPPLVRAPPEKPMPWYKKKWVWAVMGTSVAAAGLAVGLGVGLTQPTLAPYMDVTFRSTMNQ